MNHFLRADALIWLWLLPFLALWLLWLRKRRHQSLAAIIEPRRQDQVLTSRSPGRHYARILLHCTVLAGALFAYSGPQWGFEWVPVRDRGSDLYVLIDLSDSMRATDLKPNRLERARREIIDLLGQLQGERIGLVAFAGAAHTLCPLTHDYDAFTIFLDYLDSDLIPVPGTDIGAAILQAINGFDPQSARHNNILLITDGEDHGRDLHEALALAKKRSIRIFVVGIGSGEAVPVPRRNYAGFRKGRDGKIIMTRLEEAQLQMIADETGGVYSRSVAGDLDLSRVYRNGIATFQKKSDQSQQRKEFFNRYQLFLAPALAFFILSLAFYRDGRLRRLSQLMLIVAFASQSNSLLAASLEPAQRHYDEKKYAEALQNYLEAQTDEPDNPQLHYNIGNTLYRLGKYEESARAFGQSAELLKRQPTTTEHPTPADELFNAHFNHGNALFQLRRYDEALQAFDQALAEHPDDSDAKHNRALAQKLLTAQQQKNSQQGDNSQQDKKPNDEGDPSQAGGDQDQDPQNQPGQPPEPQQESSQQQEMAQQGNAQQWLSSVNEDGKDVVKKILQRKMHKARKPQKDW